MTEDIKTTTTTKTETTPKQTTQQASQVQSTTTTQVPAADQKQQNKDTQSTVTTKTETTQQVQSTTTAQTQAPTTDQDQQNKDTKNVKDDLTKQLELIKLLVKTIKELDIDNSTIEELRNKKKLIQDTINQLGDLKNSISDQVKQELEDFATKLDAEIDKRIEDTFGKDTLDKVNNAQDKVVGFWDKYGSKIIAVLEVVIIVIIVGHILF